MRAVIARIFRSSHTERWSTYQMSSSMRSLHGSVARPFTCAQPVMPGFTSSRRRWRSVYWSTCAGTGGHERPEHQRALRGKGDHVDRPVVKQRDVGAERDQVQERREVAQNAMRVDLERVERRVAAQAEQAAAQEDRPHVALHAALAPVLAFDR